MKFGILSSALRRCCLEINSFKNLMSAFTEAFTSIMIKEILGKPGVIEKFAFYSGLICQLTANAKSIKSKGLPFKGQNKITPKR